MRPVLAAAAFLAAAAATSSWAAAPNDIIWDTPAKDSAAKEGASKETMTPLTANGAAGQPDKDGIIWDTPAAPSAAPLPAAQPDAGGITWNAPPVRPSGARPSGALLTPPSSSVAGGRLAQAPAPVSADGPCREFQTTIVIDGKREPAHGTVCQQADGTWRVVNK